jgi:hypothetical protein
LVVVAGLSILMGPAVGQRPLSGAQKRDADKVLALVKESSEDVGRRAVLGIAGLGDPLRRYLQEIGTKAPERGEVLTTLRHLDWAEGGDLLTQEMSAPPDPWSLWAAQLGEILIIKGLDQWAGLQIGPEYDPAAGTLSVTLAMTSDPLLPLGGAGIERSTTRLEGKEITIEGKVFAFQPREYTLKLFGGDVILRSVGTGAFRYSLHAGAPPVARTGQTKLQRVKAGHPDLVFADRSPDAARAHCRRIQQYVFRIVDGCEPLPTYGTSDEARFAQAEQVQVDLREEPNGPRVLLVAFPHSDESLAYDMNTHGLLTGFGGRTLGVAPQDVLVWLGGNEVHETNWFFDKGKWTRPKGRLQQRVRALFPEDS